MPRVPTAALAGLTLIAGFAVPQATNQVVGALVLVAGVGWCALREVHRKPGLRITTEYGDAKLVTSGTSPSWYIPESLTSPAMRDLAQGQMDRTILRLSEASDALGGTKAIEITTNSLESARVWEARMSALGVPGYARIHPGGGIG